MQTNHLNDFSQNYDIRKTKMACMPKSQHNPKKKSKKKILIHTVITPVAALTPASPNIAVAASVTKAVAPILTTLSR